MVRIRCVVERVTFQNAENGYSVLKCAVKGSPDLVTVVGNLPDVRVGSVLLADGDWKIDRKYGKQFEALKCEVAMPATVFGLEKYLGSGLIKGVGPKYAKRIVQRFGMETMDIIETDPGRLLEIDGIGTKRVAQIVESWARQKEIRNIMMFLQDHDVSTAYAAKIFTAYGDKAIEVVKEDPYRLADDIWGIGFRTADRIAEKMGFSKDCYPRCRSGLMYTLSRLADEGHVYADREALLDAAVTLLEADRSVLVMTLDDMIRTGDVYLEKKIIPEAAPADSAAGPIGVLREDAFPEEQQTQPIYLPPFFFSEMGVSNRLKKLAGTDAPPVRADLARIESQTGMVYDEIQREAILRACRSKVMVLTGGPGTGKTTVTLGIIRAFAAAGLKLLLAAPTGRAAKRMTEATGMEAKTIHRLLEFKPPNGYQRNEESPLAGDALIIDECSMIDIVLMNSLLKAVPDTMRVIFVGDVDQLPSIGAGSVLRDLIDCGVFPVVRLTKIFRQAMNSRIILNAHAINAGRMPDLSNQKGTDFFWINDEDPDHAARQIVELVRDRLPRFCGNAQIQVLTPMQRGVVGAANLNQMLQQALNPAGEQLVRGGVTYRVNDRVMQIRNNYDKEIFNGDIGRIREVDPTAGELTVDFDGRAVPYDLSELDELTLAYATTIHKAQGSEFPVLVMPVLMTHYVMLQRNLIYTGVTRAKKLIAMVGDRKALAYAIRHVTADRRNSLLKERLRAASGPARIDRAEGLLWTGSEE